MPFPCVRRSLALLVGYAAAGASAAVALMLYAAAYAYINQSGQPLAQPQSLAKIVPEGGAIVGLLAICLPFAWSPLTVGLPLWRRLVGKYRLIGCIVDVHRHHVERLVRRRVGGISRAMLAEMVTFLVYAAPMGAFGGLVFWAIAFRRGQRPRSRAPCSAGSHDRRGTASQ